MTYLIVTREFPPQDGGISVLSFEMAKHLSAQNHKVYVLTWQYPEGEWPSDFDDKAQPFSVTRLAKPRNHWFEILALFIETITTIVSRKVQRIYATTWNFSGVAAALASLFYRVPYVVFCYGYEISKKVLTSTDRFLMRLALRRACKVYASSQVTRQRILDLVPNLRNLEWMPLGVDAIRFRPDLSAQWMRERHNLAEKKVLLTVARLFPRKGHDKVIEALPLILQKIPNVFYLVVGDGPGREPLQNKVKELGLESQVAFVGFVPDKELPAYYAASDVFILPNREVTDPHDPWVGDYEGFGIVFVEAAACGKPVVAGRSGGSFDAVKDGETGLLVNPEDPEDIARAVIRFLRDAKLAVKMGAAGRRWIEQELHWPVLLKRYEKAFESS